MTTTTNQFKYVGQGIKPENFTYVGYYTSFSVPDGLDGYDTETEFEVDFDKMVWIIQKSGWLILTQMVINALAVITA